MIVVPIIVSSFFVAPAPVIICSLLQQLSNMLLIVAFIENGATCRGCALFNLLVARSKPVDLFAVI
jgi:hypothetical protein